MTNPIDNDKEVAPNKRDSRIEELERRIEYCEAVASQYKNLYMQLQSELKALMDRQGNIQMVYDYLTRVGSDIAVKNPHLKRTLNPISKTLPPTDKKYFELMKSFKFKVSDEVYYADEHNGRVTYHLVNGIDIIDKHPRYCISDVFGYVDESKLFATEEQAKWKLHEWGSASGREYGW